MGNSFVAKFSLKISDVFFQGQTLYWTYLRIGPIDVKQTEGASVGYWVNHVTLTFDLTHDLDLVVSRSKVEIALFEEWGGGGGRLIDMERKGCELIIHDHDHDLWVTLVGWVDVLYSDWGDSRCRCAVGISSYFLRH